ncbi:MAG: HAMP domain-containing sensor histidine kinase [Thermaerobacter sp.]|nr:HAMP domain-containing sensor histidine kinase [Thermaerobacter sp.]
MSERRRRARQPASLSRRLALQAGLTTAAMVIGASLLLTVYTAVHQFTGALATARSTAGLVLDTLGPVGPQSATDLALAEDTNANDPHIWIYRNGEQILSSPNTETHPPAGPRNVTLFLGSDPRIRVERTHLNVAVLLDLPLNPSLVLLRDLLAGALTIGLAAAAGGGLFGYRSARRMLWPVQRLTRAASELRYAAAGARLPELSAADDEIGRLGHVLNDLIGDLEAQRQRDRAMLAEAAHQLRTPLQIVQGNANLLAEQGRLDTAEAGESLRAIQQAIQGMTTLTNDLLTLESARRERPAGRDLALRPWLEQMAEDARALSPGLQIELAAVAPQHIATDQQLLERAYWAVLENALHYTPQGGRVVLGCRATTRSAHLYVEDSGPGIAADELPFVADRFFRGRAGRGKRGTGLGLAIAKALVETLGGDLQLTSRVGEGTTATLVLPR